MDRDVSNGGQTCVGHNGVSSSLLILDSSDSSFSKGVQRKKLEANNLALALTTGYNTV